MKNLNIFAVIATVAICAAFVFTSCQKTEYGIGPVSNQGNQGNIVENITSIFHIDSISPSDKLVREEATLECGDKSQTENLIAKAELQASYDKSVINAVALGQPTRTVVDSSANKTIVEYTFNEGIVLTNTYERTSADFQSCDKFINYASGFNGDEYVGTAIKNPNAGDTIINGTKCYKVIVSLNVRDIHMNNRKGDVKLSKDVMLYFDAKEYDPAKVPTKAELLGFNVNCTTGVGTGNVRVSYYDGSSETLEVTADAIRTSISAENAIDLNFDSATFGEADFILKSTNNEVQEAGDITYTYFTNVYQAVYSNNARQNLTVTYTKATLMINGFTVVLLDTNPTLSSTTPVFGTPTEVTEGTTTYVKAEGTTTYSVNHGNCDKTATGNISTKVEKEIISTDPVFVKTEIVNWTENCDGSATYVIRYVYKNSADNYEETVNSASFNNTLTATGNSSINRADNNLGTANIANGVNSTVNTVYEGKLTTVIKTKTWTVSYAGGYTQTVKANFAERTFTDMGYTLTLPGNTWTLSTDAVVYGDTEVQPIQSITPASFTYNGKFGSSCSNQTATVNANIYVVKPTPVFNQYSAASLVYDAMGQLHTVCVLVYGNKGIQYIDGVRVGGTKNIGNVTTYLTSDNFNGAWTISTIAQSSDKRFWRTFSVEVGSYGTETGGWAHTEYMIPGIQYGLKVPYAQVKPTFNSDGTLKISGKFDNGHEYTINNVPSPENW